ncbi:hypothetical protein [Peptoniphilus asaccharolyticus]
MKDIAPELLEKLQEEFKKKFNASEKIKALNKKLLDKTVTHRESNELAVEVGDLLAKVFQENLSADILPDGKMYYNIAERVINPTMKQNYELISAYSTETQTIMNHEAGLHIKGVKPELNQDRINGIIERVSGEDDFDKIKWILDEPVRNFSQAIIDDTVKINAESHHKLGLKPKVFRREKGDCCDWCKQVEGVYEYPEVPKDVWRRHRYCRCTVEYYPGDGRRQNVHTKKWIDPEKDDKIEKRKKATEEKPRILHKEDVSTKDFVRGSGKNYPIKFIGSDHVKFDDEKIEKVTVIAGEGVKNDIRDAPRLESFYKQPKKRWLKISGISKIKYKGKTLKAELHWYEANGIRKEIKIKKVFDNES